MSEKSRMNDIDKLATVYKEFFSQFTKLDSQLSSDELFQMFWCYCQSEEFSYQIQEKIDEIRQKNEQLESEIKRLQQACGEESTKVSQSTILAVLSNYLLFRQDRLIKDFPSYLNRCNQDDLVTWREIFEHIHENLMGKLAAHELYNSLYLTLREILLSHPLFLQIDSNNGDHVMLKKNEPANGCGIAAQIRIEQEYLKNAEKVDERLTFYLNQYVIILLILVICTLVFVWISGQS